MGSAGWDDNPAPAENAGGWKPKSDIPAAATSGDGFKTSEENISKRAGGANDGGCRICDEDGHFARDCPNKPEAYEDGGNSGECYSCGETGHNKVDCTNPRVERDFTGTCRHCEQVGHRAADCPDAPPRLCNICHEEGHPAAECTINRMQAALADMGIKDMAVEDAWKNVEATDKLKDLDDIKEAVLTYAKAYPALTFEEMEAAFRDTGMNTFLIAKQQVVSDTHTIINLQGKQDQEFVVSFQFSAKPRRAKFAEGWPTSPEENLERLSRAGIVMDRMMPKCSNCEQMGHGSKQCTEEKVEKPKLIVTCANCNNEGHYARDCTEPRKSGRKGCKNCGGEGHIAKECPEPPNPENVECRNCNTNGHFSKDCPHRECRNCYEKGHHSKDCEKERVMKCHNCDELGHMSKECAKPTDWSRVKCNNCEEMGHTYKRCKNPAAEKPAGEDGGEGAGGHGGWGGDTSVDVW